MDTMDETLDTFLQEKIEAGAVFIGENDILPGLPRRIDYIKSQLWLFQSYLCYQN